MRILSLGVVVLAGCGTGTAAQESPMPVADFAAASAVPVPGSAAPANGSAAPANGSAAPTNGSAVPANGSAAPANGSAAPASGSAAPIRRAVNAVCQGYTDQAAGACAAKPGCSYGSPIWCSGVRPRDEDLRQLERGPCHCTCLAERKDCSLRPSAHIAAPVGGGLE